MNQIEDQHPDDDLELPERRSVGGEIRDIAADLGRRLWAQARDRQSPAWPPPWLIVTTFGAVIAVVACVVGPIVEGFASHAG